MSFPYVALLCLTPLLAIPAVAESNTSSLAGVRRIVVLGDSITEQGGLPGGYVRVMDAALKALQPDQPIEVINAGISGHRSTDMHDRFQRDVLDKHPDIVTINAGVNDVWHAFRDFERGIDHPKGDLPHGIPLPVYCEKIDDMIVAAQKAGIRVVLVSPTLVYEKLDSPENHRLNDYVHAMRVLAARRHCTFVDLNAVFRDIVSRYQKVAGTNVHLLTVDGVHMNPAGNRVMAYQILRGLGVTDAALQRAMPAP